MSGAPLLWWLVNILAIATYIALLILIIRILPKRYTLRQLLIAVTLVSLALGLVAWTMKR